MRLPIIAASAVLLACTLAACNKAQPMPTAPFTRPGVSMKLDPPDAPNCKPDTLYRATLNWSVDGIDAPKTEVRIGTPDGKVFARSNDRAAHAETSDWVRPGIWFLLFNRKNNDLLGALQAGPKPCP